MWITLLTSDIGISAEEEQLVLANVANAQSLEAICASVTNEVRGYVAAQNPLGPEGTIPSELKPAAAAIARLNFLEQIPSKRLITPQREKAAENALALLRDVAKGNFRIVPDAAPAADQPATPSPSISGRQRRDQRCEQDGL